MGMGFGRASRGARRARQGSGALHPFAALVLLPVAGLRLGGPLERATYGAGGVEMRGVEEIEGALEGQSRLAPLASGEGDAGRAIGRLGSLGEEDRLPLRVAPAMRQEGIARMGPELLVEPREQPGLRHHHQPPALRQHLLANARQHPLERRGGEVVEVDDHPSKLSATKRSSRATPKPVAPLSWRVPALSDQTVPAMSRWAHLTPLSTKRWM